MAYTYGSIGTCKLGGGATSSYYQARLGYQVNSQSIENNTSNITLRLEVRSTSSSYATRGYNQTSTIDGTALSAKTFDMSNTNTWQVFGERTITITHNSDGTYSATKSASFTTTATSTYSLKSGSASVTVAPATIPRASEPTLSASSVAMGSSVTITTNRKSTSFTHTLTYSFGNTSGTIASSVGASTTWTPPLSLANQIPSATSGTCTITCKTYNGSTLVGTKTVSLTLTVPSSVVPSISSIALSEANSAVPSSWGCYVQNKSKLRVVTTASGSYGSTIKSYKITGIDSNTYNSSDFISNVLTGSGTKTITVTVTDSRGRTATKTTTYTCVAYSNPSISVANVTRCNSDGTANEEGTYVKYTFKASISSVNNKNNHGFRIGYKLSSASSYTYVTISNDGYSLDKSNVILSGVTFSADNSYNFQFFASDYFISSAIEKSIGTGFTLMDFNGSGKSMAIGKVSEAGADKKLLEVALESKFTKQIEYLGQTLKNYICSQIYPVGSIYISVKSTNPSTLFGGTWVSWGTGKVPVGIDTSQTEFNSIEKSGGAKTVNISHTHRINGHTHSLDTSTASAALVIDNSGAIRYREFQPGYSTTANYQFKGSGTCNNPGTTSSYATKLYGKTSSEQLTSNSGGSTAINNLQPYITCYMWKRTA